jgi:hypothetical protein
MTTSNNYSLRKRVNTIVQAYTLYEIYKDFSEGKIAVYHEWLQRLSQKKAWTAKQFKKAKSYVDNLIHGGANVQSFLLVDIDHLILTADKQFVENQTDDEDTNEKNVSALYKQILDELQEMKLKGVLFLILDGQNRLKYGIAPFFENKMSVTIDTIGGKTDSYFKDLNLVTQEEIKSITIFTCVVEPVAGDIKHILDTLIAINEGEPWSTHEKRSLKFTVTSLEIAKIAYKNVNIVRMVKELSKNSKVFTGKEYSLEKRGDTLLFAEYLHFLEKGNYGDDKALDLLYSKNDKALDENINKLKSILFFISQAYIDNPKLISKTINGSYFDNLFIILNLLTNKKANNRRLMKYIFSLNDNGIINQIKTPGLFVENIFDIFTEFNADITQFEYKKDLNGNIFLDKDGKPVINRSAAKPDTWVFHNKNSTNVDIEARIHLISNRINMLIENFMDKGHIDKEDPRKIDTLSKMMLLHKTKKDPYSRFGKNISLIDKLEIDHRISVKKGGTNDDNNLVLTSRENNRKKGAN